MTKIEEGMGVPNRVERTEVKTSKRSGQGLVVGPQYGTTRSLAAELPHLLTPAPLQRRAVLLRSS